LVNTAAHGAVGRDVVQDADALRWDHEDGHAPPVGCDAAACRARDLRHARRGGREVHRDAALQESGELGIESACRPTWSA
jgi:hypothetical protein